MALHKPILMARCEMMFAMFSANFLESSAEIVCCTAYKYENHSFQHLILFLVNTKHVGQKLKIHSTLLVRNGICKSFELNFHILVTNNLNFTMKYCFICKFNLYSFDIEVNHVQNFSSKTEICTKQFKPITQHTIFTKVETWWKF